MDTPREENEVGSQGWEGTTQKLWVSEEAGIVNERKVRRVIQAQDALTVAEEKLYTTLWNAKERGFKLILTEKSQRLVQAGLFDLANGTRLSKRQLQRILESLIRKGYLKIHRNADIKHRIPTVYCVPNYSSILQFNTARGYTHVAKISKGIYFVRPLTEVTTVDTQQPSTVDGSHSATVDATSMETVDARETSTVDNTTTKEKGSNRLENRGTTTTQSSPIDPGAISNVFAQFADDVDGAAVTTLIKKCQERLPDITETELIMALSVKGSQVATSSSVLNPVAVLLKAVPEWVGDASFLEKRERIRQQQQATAAKQRAAMMGSAVRSAIAELANPNEWTRIVSELEKFINRHSFETWFKPTRFAGLRDEAILVCVPSEEFKHLADRYAGEIGEAKKALGLPDFAVRCLTSEELYPILAKTE